VPAQFLVRRRLFALGLNGQAMVVTCVRNAVADFWPLQRFPELRSAGPLVLEKNRVFLLRRGFVSWPWHKRQA